MEILEPQDIASWQGPFSPEIVAKCADALEEGRLLFAQQLPFELSEPERRFLTPDRNRNSQGDFLPEVLNATSSFGSAEDMIESKP